MFGFEYFYNIMKKNATHKIDCAVYGMWRGHILIELLITFLVANFLFFAFSSYVVLSLILLVGTYIAFIVIVSMRKIGLSYGEEGYTYVTFRGFMPKAKEAYDIPIKRIKYLKVTRILTRNYVTMSFICDTGKLKKVKMIFNDFVLGFSVHEQRKNCNLIMKELMSLQKELDRGDF